MTSKFVTAEIQAKCDELGVQITDHPSTHFSMDEYEKFLASEYEKAEKERLTSIKREIESIIVMLRSREKV